MPELPQVNEVWGDPAKPETWTIVQEVEPCGMGYFVSWERFGTRGRSNSGEWKSFLSEPGIVRIVVPSAADLAEAAKCVRYNAEDRRIVGDDKNAIDLEALAARLEAHAKEGV